MGSYSLLSLSNSPDPVHGRSENFVEGTELVFKYSVPVGWVVLFGRDDFVSKSRYEKLDGYEYAVLFRRYLNNPAASHVQLDLTEYMEIVGGSDLAKEGLREWIDAVPKPYH